MYLLFPESDSGLKRSALNKISPASFLLIFLINCVHILLLFWKLNAFYQKFFTLQPKLLPIAVVLIWLSKKCSHLLLHREWRIVGRGVCSHTPWLSPVHSPFSIHPPLLLVACRLMWLPPIDGKDCALVAGKGGDLVAVGRNCEVHEESVQHAVQLQGMDADAGERHPAMGAYGADGRRRCDRRTLH